MNKLLAVDPGLAKMGVALFDLKTKKLLEAYTIYRTKTGPQRGPEAWIKLAKQLNFKKVSCLAIEKMQVDKRTRGKVADLFEVTGVVGACSMVASSYGATVTAYNPRDWKGQLPKRVSHNRIKATLTEKEKKLIHPKATHDAYDAIGIGLFYLERKCPKINDAR